MVLQRRHADAACRDYEIRVKMTLHGIALPNFEPGLVTIRALSSITLGQADVVAGELAKLSTRWRVECHDDYDGYRSIIVSSAQPDAPTFALSGKVKAIELSEVRDDELRAHGRFSDMNEAVRSLIGLLGKG